MARSNHKSKRIIKLTVVIIIFFAIYFISHIFIQKVSVTTLSMNPLLKEGDSILVDKISYDFYAPKRFDIIAYRTEDKNQIVYGRIIALPKETVSFKDGEIYIEDKILVENYGQNKKEEITFSSSDALILGEDEYFVLGDNRTMSVNKQSFFAISETDIIGKAWIKIWPFSELSILKHQ